MKRTMVWLAVLASTLVSEAGLGLNDLFTDNMVLQRDQAVPVWGTADPGAKVTVEFAGQKKSSTTKTDGSWTVHLDPLKPSSKPRKMKVSSRAGNPAIQISNLLVGDVWVLAGQSNMAREFRTYSWLMEQLPFT